MKGDCLCVEDKSGCNSNRCKFIDSFGCPIKLKPDATNFNKSSIKSIYQVDFNDRKGYDQEYFDTNKLHATPRYGLYGPLMEKTSIAQKDFTTP